MKLIEEIEPSYRILKAGSIQMPSYHMPSTGSARSVGVRRIRKQYTFADGTMVYSRSIQEAARLAGKPNETPTLQPNAVIPANADVQPVVRGTGGPPKVTPGAGGGATTTKAAAGTPGTFTGGIPATLTALKALGKLGNTTAWTTGQWVILGDKSLAHWDGAAWAIGKAP